MVDRTSLTRSGGRLRATFHFVAVPKGTLTVTWYLTANGKRRALARVSKNAAAGVTSSLSLGKRRGLVTVEIARKGVVIAARSVRAR